jgi:transmembrane sensor
MDYLNLRNLLKAYREGETSMEQNDNLETWYLSEGQQAEDLPGDIDYAATEQRIWRKLSLQHQDGTEPTVRRIWPRMAVAAALAVIMLGIWLYYASSINGHHPKFSSGSALANDIAPGKNTAIITLAGQVIKLSNAKTGVVISEHKLTYSDGAEIRDQVRREGAQTVTASTPPGGTYQVTLPDGTKVWLNAASTLKFPSTFSGLVNRKIELSGEAYFEVFKNKKQPFVVRARKMELTVLGTHFNVNAYDDEQNTKATLLEGSVKVQALNTQGISPLSHAFYILKPDQEAILTGSSQLSVAAADIDETMAWKNGQFIFKDETLGSIMKRVARWYNVQVVYQPEVATIKFSGTISRFENISKILRILQATEKVRFKIEGRKIYVTPHN